MLIKRPKQEDIEKLPELYRLFLEILDVETLDPCTVVPIYRLIIYPDGTGCVEENKVVLNPPQIIRFISIPQGIEEAAIWLENRNITPDIVLSAFKKLKDSKLTGNYPTTTSLENTFRTLGYFEVASWIQENPDRAIRVYNSIKATHTC